MSNERKTTCPDCAVEIGNPHEEGCDVARCMENGGQRLSHLLPAETMAQLLNMPVEAFDTSAPNHDCGQDIWTGRWPGDMECEEFGWWAKADVLPWERCDETYTPKTTDLNRLFSDAVWDKEQKRWVLP